MFEDGRTTQPETSTLVLPHGGLLSDAMHRLGTFEVRYERADLGVSEEIQLPRPDPEYRRYVRQPLQ